MAFADSNNIPIVKHVSQMTETVIPIKVTMKQQRNVIEKKGILVSSSNDISLYTYSSYEVYDDNIDMS